MSGRARDVPKRKDPKDLLKVEELDNAEKIIIKLVQNVEFVEDISTLKQGKQIIKKSKLFTLDPFLENHNILRVGGRIKNSMLSYSQKHLILLPRTHHETNLIINSYHQQNYHSGTQTTLCITR